MKIAFTYNVKPKGLLQNGVAEKFAEFDNPDTINGIAEAIKANGHSVLMVEANLDAYDILRKNKDDIDLIFNFAEAVNLEAQDREAHIPMIAEILGIKYTGPTPLHQALRLNKYRAKEIWRQYEVPTPDFQVFLSKNDKFNQKLQFPLIVKANGQGSSSGIRNNSVVHNETELYERVAEIYDKYYQQPVLVEKFLEGREFTVPVLGNGEDLMVLPIIEENFSALPAGVNKIYSYEAKWIWDNPDKPVEEAVICPAKVDEILKNQIEELAKLAFLTIGCRDWGRVDMRMDKDGKLYVLELNTPVGLLPDPKEHSMLPTSARALGWSFDKLIGQIINAALKRYGVLQEINVALPVQQ